ncbi:MAG: hypothetical protein FVQ79_04200 [Planctomycetes bacterium]|nr:hypothetical protein [Planctomycetota bacterium]
MAPTETITEEEMTWEYLTRGMRFYPLNTAAPPNGLREREIWFQEAALYDQRVKFVKMLDLLEEHMGFEGYDAWFDEAITDEHTQEQMNEIFEAKLKELGLRVEK